MSCQAWAVKACCCWWVPVVILSFILWMVAKSRTKSCTNGTPCMVASHGWKPVRKYRICRIHWDDLKSIQMNLRRVKWPSGNQTWRAGKYTSYRYLVRWYSYWNPHFVRGCPSLPLIWSVVSPRGTVLAASSGDRRLFRGGRGCSL